jgi:hypothetical protein
MRRQPDTAYTVFIDESFGEGFTVLSREDAYFCYAALMVPTAKLADLGRCWLANRARLLAAYKLATGFEIQGELKSGYMNKLSFQDRRKFGERLAYFLRKNDCFVAGFYTTVRNMLAYNLRTQVAMDDDAKEMPANWETMLPGVKAKLLADKPNQPGDAYVLLGLFHQTLSISLNWLSTVGATFDVVYDPRQKKEDSFLIRHADDWLKREAEVKKLVGVYTGATAVTSSDNSPGLMLADLILRDVRFLFTDLPELLTEHSSTTLILPVPQGHEPVVMTLNGARLKWGDRRPMSDALRRKLRSPSQNSMLPLYFDRLAGGKLSCEAVYGESRVVNFGLGCLEDMTD